MNYKEQNSLINGFSGIVAKRFQISNFIRSANLLSQNQKARRIIEDSQIF
uniref:Uncharacterized protein n=1 Tax=Rhizophora mucronata TaxID=61149 RepID=A0A2P2NTT6_RHIMU